MVDISIKLIKGAVDHSYSPLPETIFCPARQKACDVVISHKRVVMPSGGKSSRPVGFRLKKHHCVLLIAHLEYPNHTLRAFIDAFSGRNSDEDERINNPWHFNPMRSNPGILSCTG